MSNEKSASQNLDKEFAREQLYAASIETLGKLSETQSEEDSLITLALMMNEDPVLSELCKKAGGTLTFVDGLPKLIEFT